MSRAEVDRPMEQPKMFDIEGLFRHAIEKGGGPETMTTLMNVRRELNAEAAKKAFDDAMSGFKKDCPVIIKDKEGAIIKSSQKAAYKYSPLESVEMQIKSIETAHGLRHSFPACGCKDKFVSATVRVIHEAGHFEEATVEYPIGTKTDVMSETQVYAAAETFCKRRALANIYALTFVGDDIDMNTGKVKPKGPSSLQPSDTSVKELATELWNLLKPIMSQQKDWNKANWNAHNQWLYKYEILDGAVPESAPDLSIEKFKTVIAKVKTKLKELGL